MIDRGFENEDGSISLMELKTGKMETKVGQEEEPVG